MPQSVMMFAAGFGTRMGVLTESRPKPLIPVAGTALIDHTLRLVREIEPARIVANLHYLADQMVTHLDGSGVVVSIEQPEILETGGGLRHALPLLGEGPVFTTNTDAIWAGPNPFRLAQAHWDPSRMDALAVCVRRENTMGHAGRGDFRLAQTGQITRGPGLVYGGVQILKTDHLRDMPDKAFSLNRVWDRMIAQGRMFGVSYPGHWCDVGTADGIVHAEKLLEHGNV